MTSGQDAVSREPAPGSRFDWWRTAGLVTVGSPGEKDPFTLVLAAAAAAPLVILFLLLMPRQTLLFVPLLILVPLSFLGIHAFEYIFLLALFAYLLRRLSGHRFGFRPTPVEIAFMMYLAWACISFPQVEDVHVALVGLKTPIVFFLAFLAGSRVFGLSRFPALLRIYTMIPIAIALQIVAVFLVEFHGQGSLTSQMGKYTDLGWGQSNYVAAVAALAASAGLPGIVFRPGAGRRLAVLGALAAAFVVYATASRGGTLALAMGLILGLVSSRLNLRWGVLILVGALGILLLSPLGQAVLVHWVSPKGLPSIGMRFLFYREALAIIAAHPVFGVGPDQIPFHTYIYMDANPHNVLLKQAADYGLVGLALYLVILVLVARRMIHQQQGMAGGWDTVRARTFFLLFFVALINSSFEPALVGPHYGFLFWLMAGTLCAPPEDGEETRPA
jgi:O-antigen ligase